LVAPKLEELTDLGRFVTDLDEVYPALVQAVEAVISILARLVLSIHGDMRPAR
jgi:hypothetical protein